MPELQRTLEKLVLRLDSMGLRVEQAVLDSLRAAHDLNIEFGAQVNANDAAIDHEEVEIEQECIRLLALFQPAAIDLRTICTIIKVNADLERIADLAAGVGRRVKRMVAEGANIHEYPDFDEVERIALDLLHKTMLIISSGDTEMAREVIGFDKLINQGYKRFVRSVLEREKDRPGGTERTLTLFMLSKTLERIGDHCTNIAEDIIYLKTGEIVRHSGLS